MSVRIETNTVTPALSLSASSRATRERITPAVSSFRMRRQQGVVEVSFLVDSNGRALEVTLTSSSNSRILDQQSLELVRRLRFPEPPTELGSEPIRVNLPLRYSL